MPRLSRWFLKSGLLFLLLSLALETIMAFHLSPILENIAVYFRPAALHLFLMGWVTQIIIGVSLWMFPRLKSSKTGYPDVAGWVVFICLNTGLLLRLIAEPLVYLRPEVLWQILLTISAVLQWSAGAVYLAVVWKRVRGK